MKLITTAEWGANQSKDATADSHPIGSTIGVTLHWEGPHMGVFSHERCAEKVRSIERHHEYGNGWGDVAYNLLVCPHGYIFEGRGAGVRSAANGDTKSNDDWYAVCYLGGEGDGFTAEGKQGMRAAVRYLRSHGAGPRVNGHRDHKPTACPGDEIYRWLNNEDFDLPARHDLKPPSEEDDMSLDEPLNIHDPKGNPLTAGVTLREVASAYWIELVQGRKAAEEYAQRAMKSPAKEK